MIFTGLSNNWALLQRVNAIEKYLSENPIVPYAKASVAGEGTDTFVFNKPQLSVANGADLMVGDLIICPDGTLWQVISIADSGEVTARFLVSFKGEQGEQGISQLVYNLIYDKSEPPSREISYNIDSQQFNRLPMINDRFILLYYDTTTKKSYICVCRVNAVVAMQATINIIDFEDITGTKGDNGKEGLPALVALSEITLGKTPTVGTEYPFARIQLNRVPLLNEKASFFIKDTTENVVYECYGTFTTISTGFVFTISSVTRITGEKGDKLYEHTIIFEQQGHTRILVQLYTRSATPMSYDDVASYLNNRETSASGIHNAAAFSQTTPSNYVYSVYAHEGVIYVNRLLDNSGMPKTISKADVTTTDTVEEI